MRPSTYLGAFGGVLKALSQREGNPGLAGALQQDPVTTGGALQEVTVSAKRAPAGDASFSSIWGQAGAKEREAAAKQLIDAGVDIDAQYEQILRQGVKPPTRKKLTREDKAELLIDFGLRMLSSKRDFAGALGESGQGTLDKYRGMQAEDAQRQQQEQAIQQQVALRKVTRAEGELDRKRGALDRAGEQAAEMDFRAGEADKDRTARLRERREELASLDRRAKQDAKPRTTLATNDRGEAVLIDADTGATTPVTEEVTVPGKRGRKFTERRPLKPQAKPNPSGVDQDTLIRAVNDEFKNLAAIRDDITKPRNPYKGMSDDELNTIAVQNVQKRYNALTTGALPSSPPAPQNNNPFDQFDAK